MTLGRACANFIGAVWLAFDAAATLRRVAHRRVEEIAERFVSG